MNDLKWPLLRTRVRFPPPPPFKTMKILTNNKKELNMNDQVQKLQNRVSNLSDRIHTLERELKDTQEKIQFDVNRLANLVIALEKRDPTASVR